MKKKKSDRTRTSAEWPCAIGSMTITAPPPLMQEGQKSMESRAERGHDPHKCRVSKVDRQVFFEVRRFPPPQIGAAVYSRKSPPPPSDMHSRVSSWCVARREDWSPSTRKMVGFAGHSINEVDHGTALPPSVMTKLFRVLPGLTSFFGKFATFPFLPPSILLHSV
jgi:hypothetical protein